MVQARGRLRLPPEPVDEVRVPGELREQDLDGDGAVEHGVDAAVDLAHATGADPGLHPVAAAQLRCAHTVPSLIRCSPRYASRTCFAIGAAT